MHRGSERDLDVDFEVGSVDAGRIVDRIGVEADAARGRLDAAALRQPKIGALADDLAAKLRPGDADRIIGAVAGLIVGLGRCAHIGSDAAEPQEIDRELQDRAHHLLGRRLAARNAEQLPRRRGELDLLRGAREHPAAGRDLGLVVIAPARARQIEQPLALPKAGLGLRLRIEKDVAVIERGDQPDGALEQHAVAEHVARHVADPGDRERR